MDDDLLNSIFDWLCKHPDIEIKAFEGDNSTKNGSGQGSDPSDDTTQNDAPQAPIQQATSSLKPKLGERRIVTSADRVWHTIAGHGIDHKRVPPLELDCLSIIAAHGSAGILQPYLTKLTGQDKRSVPKRTDSLSKKGYITKQIVIGTGSKTSILRLKKFSQEQKFTASGNPHAEPGSQLATNQVVFYDAYFDETIRMLKENNNVISMRDLRIGLGIHLKKWESKVLIRCIRRLAEGGCIRTLTARLEDQDGNVLKQASSGRDQRAKSIQLLREPTEHDRLIWSKNGYKGKKQAVQNGADASSHVNDGATERIGEDEELSDAESLENDIDPEKQRIPPQWTPDLPYPNLVYNIVDGAGRAGISSMNLAAKATGPFWRRPLDEITARLTDIWQISQPPHLRHLTLVRDTALHGRMAHFQYRSLENFEKAVEANEAVWEAVQRAPNSGHNSNGKTDAAPADLDQWGFPKLQPKDFTGRDGRATLAQCRSLIPAHPFGTKGDASEEMTDMTPDDGASTRNQSTPVSRKKYTKKVERKNPGKRVALTQKRQLGVAKKETEEFHLMAQALAERRAMQEIKTGRKRTIEESGLSNTDVERPSKAHRTDATVQDSPEEQYISIVDVSPDRVAQLKAEILAHEKPGIYINPPGSLATKIDHCAQVGRPRKALIAVFKTDRLRELPWFVEDLATRKRRREPAQTTPRISRVVLQDTILDVDVDIDTPSRKRRRKETLSSSGGRGVQSTSISMISNPADGEMPSSTNGTVLVPLVTTSDRLGSMHSSTVTGEPSQQPDFSNISTSAALATVQHLEAPSNPASPDRVCSQTTTPTYTMPNLDTSLPQTTSVIGNGATDANQVVALRSRLNELRHRRGRRSKATLAEMAQLQKDIAAYEGTQASGNGEGGPSQLAVESSLGATSSRIEGKANGADKRVLTCGSSLLAGIGGTPAISDQSSTLPKSAESSVHSHVSPKGNNELQVTNDASNLPATENSRHTGVPGSEGLPSTSLAVSANEFPQDVTSQQRLIRDLSGQHTAQFQNSPDILQSFDVTPAKPTALGKTGPKPGRKAGTARTGGTILAQRQNIILDAVRQCYGVFPGNHEMWYVFVTAWKKKYDQTPDKHTIDRAIVNLTQSGKLKKWTFQFKSKKGLVQRRSILTEPSMDPETPIFKQLQSKMIDAHPAQYLPFEVEIEEHLRSQANNVHGLKKTSKAKPEAASVETSEPVSTPKRKSKQSKQFVTDESVVVRQTSISAANADLEARRQGFANAQEQLQHKMSQRKALDQVQQRKNIEKARLDQDLVPEWNSDDDDEGDITEDQAAMQGAMQVDSYKHDLSAAMPPRDKPRAKLSRVVHFDRHPILGATRRPLSSLRSSTLGRHPITGLPNTSQEGCLQPSAQGAHLSVNRDRLPKPQEQASSLLTDTTQSLHVSTGTFSTFTNLARVKPPKPLLSIRQPKLRAPGVHSDVQATPKDLDDILDRASGLGHPPADTHEARANQYFYDVERVQEWEMALLRSGSELSDTHEWSFINHGLNCPHIRAKTEVKSQIVMLQRTNASTTAALVASSNIVSTTAQSSLQHLVSLTGASPEKQDTSIFIKPKRKYKPRAKKIAPKETPLAPDLGALRDESATVDSLLRNGTLQKRDRKSGAAFKDADRLVTAYALVSTICGGINQNRINWNLVAHALSFRYDAEFLRRRWAYIKSVRSREVGQLQNAIREPFLRAYKNGELPSIDFQHLGDTDWPGLFDWVEKEIFPLEPDQAPEVPNLSLSKSALENEYVIRTKELTEIDPDDYFASITDQGRKNFALSFCPGTRLPKPIAPNPGSASGSMLARSWIRAVSVTKQWKYNPQAAARKLGIFSDPILEKISGEMVEAHFLSQDRKGRQLPGRNFQIHNDVLSQFRRWPGKQEEYMFLRAVAGARTAMVQHFQSESELHLVPTAPDPQYLVLMNMVAQGLLAINVILPERNDDIDAPFPKLSPLGYSGLHYETKKTDMSRLKFPIVFRKTSAFTPDHELTIDVPIPMLPNLVDGEPGIRMPFWVDIHGNLIDDVWDMVVRSLMHLLVFRPGSMSKAMENAHKGKLWRWEIEMVLDWMYEVGLAVHAGGGTEESGRENQGWRASDWWYCAFLPEVAKWKPPARLEYGVNMR